MLRNGSVGAIPGGQLNVSSCHAGKLFLDLSASDAGTIIGQVESLVFRNNEVGGIRDDWVVAC